MIDTSRSVGVVYVAFGEKYRREARRSLRSLSAVTNVGSAVITDQHWDEDPVPSEFIIHPSILSFRSKPALIYKLSPFDDTLFLDTDTVVMRNILPLFSLLQHYDIGVNFGGAQLNEQGGLELHSQCNSGVILFRKKQEVQLLFENWLSLYDVAASSSEADDSRGLNDQRYLAIAIAKSKSRPVHLGAFLNFALFDNIVTASPPVIYHGRDPWIECFGDYINKTWDPASDWQGRVWLPNLAGFLPRGIRRSDPALGFAIILRRSFNEIKWRIRCWRRRSE